MRTSFLSSTVLLIAGLVVGPATAQAPQPRWPSLEEQLARDRVPAGSALAKFANELLDDAVDPFTLAEPLGRGVEEIIDDIALP